MIIKQAKEFKRDKINTYRIKRLGMDGNDSAVILDIWFPAAFLKNQFKVTVDIICLG